MEELIFKTDPAFLEIYGQNLKKHFTCSAPFAVGTCCLRQTGSEPASSPFILERIARWIAST